MSGPKRNPDKLNTIGVVVVGICGAVLVYVTITALQAFYMDDTSEIQTMADYGGQDTFAKAIRTTQEGSIKEYAPNGAVADPSKQTYRIAIDQAMKKVVEDARKDPSNLVPLVGKSDTPTIMPIFGRPKPLPGAGSGSGSAAPPPADAGSGSAATNVPAAPQAPTGGIGASGNPPPGAPAPAAGSGSGAAAKTPKKGPPKQPPGAGSASSPRAPAKGNAR